MIQGRSNFVYRIGIPILCVIGTLKRPVWSNLLHVDANIVSNDVLDVEAFKNWRPEYHNAELILEDGVYLCGWAGWKDE